MNILYVTDIARVGEIRSAYTNFRFIIITSLNMNDIVLWYVKTCS